MMQQVMPTKQRTLASLGLGNEQPIVVALEVLVFDLPVSTIPLLEPVSPYAPIHVLTYLRSTEE